MSLSVTSLFCCLDDFARVFEEWERQRLIPTGRTRLRRGKLALSGMLFIMTLFLLSPFRNFKHVQVATSSIFRACRHHDPGGNGPVLPSLCSPVLWLNPIVSTRASLIQSLSFLLRPRIDDRGKLKPSRIPVQVCTCVHGFLRQRGAPQLLSNAVLRVLPSTDAKVSALRIMTFSMLNHPSRHAPLPTLRSHPHKCERMARGGNGS